MRRDGSPNPAPPPACHRCALLERRTFLQEAAVALAGAVAALSGRPGHAAALSVQFAQPMGSAGEELTYPIASEDGAQIDRDNQVIVVRYQERAYAFNLACPHQNTALRWQAEDLQFQCPRHHSRYRPDGEFVSGRATRGMDRFAVRRDGGNIVVNVSRLYRQDQDGAEWGTAVVQL